METNAASSVRSSKRRCRIRTEVIRHVLPRLAAHAADKCLSSKADTVRQSPAFDSQRLDRFDSARHDWRPAQLDMDMCSRAHPSSRPKVARAAASQGCRGGARDLDDAATTARLESAPTRVGTCAASPPGGRDSLKRYGIRLGLDWRRPTAAPALRPSKSANGMTASPWPQTPTTNANVASCAATDLAMML